MIRVDLPSAEALAAAATTLQFALVGVGGSVLVIIMLTALISIRRVLVLEPAVVFRG